MLITKFVPKLFLFDTLKSWNSLSILTKHVLFLGGKFRRTFILSDILDYIDRTGETGILVSLDQEKAFDRVNRTSLQNLLTRFGFGASFCHWIDAFYNGANMRVIVDERLTEPIPLSRGVCQGDSLSPMLYILCVETLACKIRSCSGIEGFLLPGAKRPQCKVGVYADDTTSLVKSVHSLEALLL